MPTTPATFTSNPQAKDDLFTNTGLTEDSLGGVKLLDVMGNDLGTGNTLYSLADGKGESESRSKALLTQDAIGTVNQSALGAKIWITAEGKVAYDASALNTTQFQSLAAGQSATDTFTYAIKLSNGMLSWATAKAQITGTNDAPVIDLSSLTIDGDSSSGKVTGTLRYSDPDKGDQHSAGVALAPLVSSAGAPNLSASLAQALRTTINDEGENGKGALKWNFALPSGTPKLATGQAVLANYQLSIADNHGGNSAPQDIGFLVVGTGSTPKVYSVAARANLTEQGGKTGSTTLDQASGTLSGNELGLEDKGALTSALVMTSWSTGGTIPSTAATVLATAITTSTVPTSRGGESEKSIAWQFSAQDRTFDFLAAGETLTLAYRISSSKEEDGKSKIVTLTVTGTNDAPVITNTAAAVVGAVTEDTTLSATGQLSASDVDHGATQTWSVQGAATGVYGAIAVDATGKWTYALDNAAHQNLAAGETHTETFVVRVTDDQGAAVDQSVAVTVTGTNDAPVITNTAAALVGFVKEDTALTVTGQLSATDVDNGATQTWSVQGAATGIYGAIAVDATGKWTYALDNAAHQNLAAGESHTETFTVRVTDDKNAFVDQLVSITVTGTNDAPLVATADVTGAVTEQGTPSGNLTDSGTIAFTDVDLTDAHSISAVTRSTGALGTLTASVSTDTTGNGTGGVVSWNYSVADSAVEYLAAGQTKVESFNFNVLDGHGGSVARTVSVTITGTNDAPTLATLDAITTFDEVSFGGGWGFTTAANLSGGMWHTDNPGAHLEVGAGAVYGVNDPTQVNELEANAGDPSNLYTNITAKAGVNYSVSLDYSSRAGVEANSNISVFWGGNLIGHLSSASVGMHHFSFSLPVAVDGTYRLEFRADDSNGAGGLLDNISIQHDGPVTAAVFEQLTPAGNLSASGAMAFSDVDLTDVHLVSATGTSGSSALGTLSVVKNNDTTGTGAGGQLTWTYTVADSAVEYLAAGQTKVESFNVTVNDQHGGLTTKQIDVTITGTNDAPIVVAADVTGSVTEQVTPAGNLTDSGTIAFTDVDLTDAHSLSSVTASAGALGTLTANVSTDTTGSGAGGVVTWNYSVADSAVEYLAAGQTKVESFSFNVLDGHGGSVARTVDVTVTGTNDAPVLQGTQTDQLYTSSLSVWTPFLVNNGVWVTPTGASSGDTVPHTFVRQFTAAQDGNYVFQFAVDNEGSVLVDGVAIPGLFNNDWSHSTVQTVALTAGIHTVTMNALNWGGPAAFAMNITDPNNHEIWNTRTHLDPEPLILSYTENQAAMVVSAGLTLTDIDSPTMTHATVAVGTGFAAGQDTLGFANQNGISGAYDASTGVLSLSGSATQAQYQVALRSVTYSNSSDSPSTADRTINFVVDDGSSQSSLSNTVQSKIVILAVNDAATISGTSTGTVTEDTTLTTGGSLAVSDVDSGEAVFRVQTAAAGTYGSFSIGTSGNWSYTLNNSAANVQALNTADHVSDSFTVLSQDGTASQVVTVGINGLDDNRPPVAANDNLGSGTGAVNFNLLANDTDPDTGSVLSVNSFDALSANGVAISVVNGLATMNTAGSAAYKALAAGQTLVDTFTYDIKDQLGAVSNRATGTYTLVGVNDAATMTGDVAGSVKEDTTLSASGRLAVTDPDSGQSFARAQTTTGTYGTFTVDVNGNWAYNLNNSLSAVQALAQGSTVNQTFTVASQDNSASKIVTVAVNGTNDAPVAANDTISGGKLTFEAGTYTQSGNTITTGDFKFDGSYVTGYWGADSTNTIYSSGWYSTSPITMTRTDGQSFKLESANVTGYSYGYGQATETVTGYLHGVQVASQAFAVPESAYGARNNTVGLTDPGFSAVDQVVFSLSGPYYEYQWLDNITIPNTVAQARDVSVLLNDTDVDAGARLSVASFSGFSAHGAAISLNANGTLHYDPTVSAELQAVHQGVNVYDTFTYQSQDEFGALSNLATVGVTVVGVHA